jgi:hypothetical protein
VVSAAARWAAAGVMQVQRRSAGAARKIQVINAGFRVGGRSAVVLQDNTVAA